MSFIFLMNKYMLTFLRSHSYLHEKESANDNAYYNHLQNFKITCQISFKIYINLSIDWLGNKSVLPRTSHTGETKSHPGEYVFNNIDVRGGKCTQDEAIGCLI